MPYIGLQPERDGRRMKVGKQDLEAGVDRPRGAL